MPQQVLTYYERELAYLRQLGGEFALKYPKIASRLSLSADKCADPHVERLIEAVAFLTARVQQKIDDEFPEITDSLLGVLFPHYLAPIPSVAVVQFVLDPEQGKLATGYSIDRGASLYSQPVNSVPCRFRTCYPVTIWPIEVKAARFDGPNQGTPSPTAAAVIRVELHCQSGVILQELKLDRLRFFLHGDGPVAYLLYELLFNNTCQVQVRPLAGESGPKPVVLSPQCLKPVGFERDEGMLPYSARSFSGYRFLQEYFAFPEKFLFCDLHGLDQAAQAGFRKGMELFIFLDRAPRTGQTINAGNFRLGCAPIVNLFEQIAEPIRLDQVQTEYRVVPDIRRENATEVYAINSVSSVAQDSQEAIPVQPFYSVNHAEENNPNETFWFAIRRPSLRKDRDDKGTEVYLSLVDLKFQPAMPAGDTLTIRTTCTNRDLPGKLPFGGERKGGEQRANKEFELEGAAPLKDIVALTKPTESLRLPSGRNAHWRLISQLSLNYLSLCEGGEEALREMLRLYDFSERAATQQQIAGITKVSSRRVVRRPMAMPWNGFCRGLEVTLEFDEDKYVGGGVFLFASVLEKFLGLYTSVNSFTQFIATTQQREGPLKRWLPRAGEQILL